MTDFCDRCKHDRRRHHRFGGCCEKIPPYVGDVKTCNCSVYRAGMPEGVET